MGKKTGKRPGPPKGKGKDKVRTMRIPEDEWRTWQAIAEDDGVSLTSLVRQAMNRLAKRRNGK